MLIIAACAAWGMRRRRPRASAGV
ncbi:hypothetical protein [Verrucomicrobium spinosum]